LVIAAPGIRPGGWASRFAHLDIRQTRVGLADQLLFEEALQQRVEGSSPEPDGAPGALFDLFDNGVAVPFSVRQGEENLENKWCKWKKRKVIIDAG